MKTRSKTVSGSLNTQKSFPKVAEFRGKIKEILPPGQKHDIERITISGHGVRGFCVEVYEETDLHLFKDDRLIPMEPNSYYEPDFRQIHYFIEKII